MTGVWIILLISLTTLALGVVETILHRRNLRKIPIRIHVNGTRGKSSVTRLIAAGLRESGRITCAKTTGTLARMILPDGREYPVFRPSKANVIEQLRIVSAAASSKAEVLVIECMALQPSLQSLSEFKFIRATHGVITNARPDHLDVMGPGDEDVALALAGMIPVKGKLFTAEAKHLAVFAKAAQERGSELTVVSPDDIAAVTPEDMAGFNYVEHEENVALALKVCEDLGVDRQTALKGMMKAQPDPGAMCEHEIRFFGRRIRFINGFAANDPESTERIWHMAIERSPECNRRVAIFNCRVDRPDRSVQLGRACVEWHPADHYVLIGTGTYIFARAAVSKGMDASKFVFAEDRRVDEIFEIIMGLVGPSAMVMGMGNIGGPGLELVRYFRNRSIVEEIE